MNHIALPSIVLLLSMATCAALPPPPETAVAADSCDSIAAGWVVGDQPTPDVIERAQMESGSPTVRVIAPGEQVAMDYRPERLTITTGDGGTIARLSCG